MEIKLKNLTKIFPSKDKKNQFGTAVDDFNIDIEDDDFEKEMQDEEL